MGSTNWNFLGLGLALSATGALGAGLALAEPAKVPAEAFAPIALTAQPLPVADDAAKPPDHIADRKKRAFDGRSL